MQNEAIERGNQDETAKPIFKPDSWLTKIDYINHLVLFNNVLIAVLAEQGAGKTTFCHLLQANLDSQIKSHLMKATVPFSQADFLVQLDSAFHLRIDSKATLAHIVRQINERKSHVLMIIDDAQNLSDAFLQEALFELKHQGDHGYFHLCLISDFSLVASLNKLEANLIHTLEPGSLTESETKTYVLNSLPAPRRLDQTMTEKRLEQFYQLTGGNIARINNQMINYFCPEPLKSQPQHKSRVKNIGFVTGAAMTLIVSSYIWHHHFLPSSEKTTEQDLAPYIAEIRPPLPSILPVVPASGDEAAVLISQLPDIGYELAHRASHLPAWYVEAVREPAQPSPRRATDIALDDGTDDLLVVRDRVVVIPKTLPAHKPTSIKKVVLNKATSVKTVKKVLPSGASRYTIQLLASPNREDVKRFFKRLSMKKGAKIRTTKRNGLNWYVLTLGDYDQYKQAQVAIKQLPPEFGRYNPWVRSLSQLKMIG
ncbi:AAA family ATPase [Legionella fairfieldensis]|uniref:AAA family ATPase n=1 Tax=Legionella fairfieldensis TaxID=45064 RepID=UPI00048A7272|nr:AAA family ATPase [Legionella fairfieldensis]